MLPVARATESTPSPICRRSVRRVGPPADARPCVAAAEPCHHKERADSNPQDPRVSLLRRCNTAGAKTHCHAAWASHRHQKESLRKELGALEPDFLLECVGSAHDKLAMAMSGDVQPKTTNNARPRSPRFDSVGIGVPASQPRSGKEQAREPRRRDQQTRRGPFALLDDTAGTRPSMGAA
jgi:hypothetical protein